MASKPTTPQWFIDRDYSYIRNLDHMGWYHALMTRSILDPNPESELKLSPDGSENKITLSIQREIRDKADYWDQYLSRTGPPQLMSHQSQAIPAVKEVQTVKEAKTTLLDSETVLCSINLAALEGTIIKQFVDLLLVKKLIHPTKSIILTGNPKPENKVFKRYKIARWGSNQIIPLYDLLIWRKVLKKNITDYYLGKWLISKSGLTKDSSKDLFRSGKNDLNEAIGLTSALLFESSDQGE